MLRTWSIALFLGLVACSGKGKGGGTGPGSGSGTDTDPEPDPKSTTPCCCELYDLETPDITYSSIPESECAAQEGRCEPTNEYCEGE